MGFFKRKTDLPANIEWLIVGLGNPGKKYAFNRHNTGWMVASALCEKYKKPIMPFSNLYYQSSLRIDSKLVFVALPTTFMNNSGEAVSAICSMYKIPIDKILIIVDEYNFPVGKIQLKSGGGDGGHNGISSIIEHLDSNEFFRLRCGIGNNFSAGEISDYVLSDFKESEIEERNIMIGKAVESIEALVKLEAPRAMSLINSGELWKKDEPEIKKNDTP
ncbi:MAG: aminoacyl-tRNA hydrolase [bacterium]